MRIGIAIEVIEEEIITNVNMLRDLIGKVSRRRKEDIPYDTAAKQIRKRLKALRETLLWMKKKGDVNAEV